MCLIVTHEVEAGEWDVMAGGPCSDDCSRTAATRTEGCYNRCCIQISGLEPQRG
ncbi:hypothetical protein [Paenibacillus wynnii]|uniref:hypothetical protein n=1 Tax=Paenibacillus wynnii TaxID=268407 RepID=UPI00278EA3AD|nr:hypothetical protein [Paenibacillus wynnii]MDQ0192912.1 hypothetical protein [Paenibacillus wynnii]